MGDRRTHLLHFGGNRSLQLEFTELDFWYSIRDGLLSLLYTLYCASYQYMILHSIMHQHV